MAYKAVIGLEFHCEMKSHTKVFSDAINGYSKLSNEYVRPLDMAFPGTLPMVNEECVKKAIKMAMILPVNLVNPVCCIENSRRMKKLQAVVMEKPHVP